MPRIDANRLNLEETVVQVARVSKVVKGGRRFSYRALVVVGDRAGHVGVGLGKASEVPEAIKKGVEDAKKRLIEVPLLGTTIPFTVTGTFSRLRGDAQACRARYQRHRRWRGARRRRGGGHSRHPHQVAGQL